ncbi:MAG: hypothetical protein IE933_13050 [Sphingomonadales bacterium]|nr:hypothetical protein [Sphingomonadales bacterium]MBD3773952.1 hypothetical protein [Paracoccaceae bacterium]
MAHYPPREARKPVRLAARLNHDGAWSDVMILNVSRKGLMAQGRRPPRRGEFIEIRRGSNVIVAQVRWASCDRFGVLAQDAIDLAALADDSHRRRPPCTVNRIERRTAPRPPGKSLPTAQDIADRAAASARWGRMFEFACVAMALALLGAVLAEGAGELLSAPAQRARLAMAH